MVEVPVRWSTTATAPSPPSIANFWTRFWCKRREHWQDVGVLKGSRTRHLVSWEEQLTPTSKRTYGPFCENCGLVVRECQACHMPVDMPLRLHRYRTMTLILGGALVGNLLVTIGMRIFGA